MESTSRLSPSHLGEVFVCVYAQKKLCGLMHMSYSLESKKTESVRTRLKGWALE